MLFRSVAVGLETNGGYDKNGMTMVRAMLVLPLLCASIVIRAGVFCPCSVPPLRLQQRQDGHIHPNTTNAEQAQDRHHAAIPNEGKIDTPTQPECYSPLKSIDSVHV